MNGTAWNRVMHDMTKRLPLPAGTTLRPCETCGEPTPSTVRHCLACVLSGACPPNSYPERQERDA